METSTQAFTLPELITVIAIIGVIAAIAIPAMSNFTGSAQNATVKAMAQRLAATYMTALTTGHDFAEGETEANAVVSNVVAGVTIDDYYFGVPHVSTELQTDDLAHLDLQRGRLTYLPD